MNISLKRFATYITISVLVALILGTVITRAATPSTLFHISGGIYPRSNYTIWKESTNYFAKNLNGQIEFSGTNASEVLLNCIGQLSSGGEIILTADNYYFDTTITVTSSITIKGEASYLAYGAAGSPSIVPSTNLVLNSGVNDNFFQSEQTASWKEGIVLQNLYLNANRYGQSDGHGIAFQAVRGFTIKNVMVWGAANDSLFLDSCGYGVVTESRFINASRHNIETSASSDYQITNNDLGGATLDAIHLVGGTGQVSNNKIFVCRYGLWTSASVLFSGNIINDMREHSIYLYGANDVNVVGNTVFFKTESGTNTTDNTYDLIYAVNPKNCSITGNLLRGWYPGHGCRYGINVEGTSTNDTVIDANSVNGAQTKNINIHAGVPNDRFHLGDNAGYRVENFGSATISASTSVTINHGLDETPTAVLVTLGTTGAGDYYADTFTATQFTVHVANSGTYTVYWKAYYQP